MRGTIRQIDPERQGPLGRFIRVHFDTDSGYRMLDLVKSFRNFKHWQKFLEIGITLKNLQGMGANKLNADSVPIKVEPTATITLPEPTKMSHGVPTRSNPASTTYPNRVLTHKLTHNPATDRWTCKCGYMLGRDGHKALYAQCPLTKQTLFQASKGAVGSVDEAQAAAVARDRQRTYHETKITAVEEQLGLFQKQKGRNERRRQRR